eukprot:comp21240_c0_seq2/m.45354 comp21240_c0_seq2/g.45354  ORF comp21240_c0_seq2/g.45354 comp21240_c0_seq2/m.45354 type:complete len:364 (-) comp21240_c0_seq2:338-1429(-)
MHFAEPADDLALVWVSREHPCALSAVFERLARNGNLNVLFKLMVSVLAELLFKAGNVLENGLAAHFVEKSRVERESTALAGLPVVSDVGDVFHQLLGIEARVVDEFIGVVICDERKLLVHTLLGLCGTHKDQKVLQAALLLGRKQFFLLVLFHTHDFFRALLGLLGREARKQIRLRLVVGIQRQLEHIAQKRKEFLLVELLAAAHIALAEDRHDFVRRQRLDLEATREIDCEIDDFVHVQRAAAVLVCLFKLCVCHHGHVCFVREGKPNPRAVNVALHNNTCVQQTLDHAVDRALLRANRHLGRLQHRGFQRKVGNIQRSVVLFHKLNRRARFQVLWALVPHPDRLYHISPHWRRVICSYECC